MHTFIYMHIFIVDNWHGWEITGLCQKSKYEELCLFDVTLSHYPIVTLSCKNEYNFKYK